MINPDIIRHSREYQRLLDLQRDVENADCADELFQPGQIDRMMEEVEAALVKCRERLGIKA